MLIRHYLVSGIMTKKDTADFVMRTLERLYPDPGVPLNHRDPFTLLVAVMLSAQCTDKRVNETTPKLFRKARTPRGMCNLDIKSIENIIHPCGLAPTKAANIFNMSRLLLERHEGKVPGTLEQLEALPGVGHKTASVIMIHAFNTPAFPVDTHIHRLMNRWGLSNGKNVVQTEKDAKKLFPREKWAKLHVQLIYFGREHCPARGHNIEECPICSNKDAVMA